MDSTPRNESITEIVPFELGSYIKQRVPGIREFYDEFPNSSRAFRMPSVSVICKTTSFRPTAVPYKTKEIQESDITSSKAGILWVVGDWDFTIQVDIWAGSKEERDDLFDATFNWLNPDISPMGLGLILKDYWRIKCDYLYIGHTFADSEISSQKDEWRATLDLIATCKAIRDRKEFVIETIDLDADVATEPIE